MMEWFRFYTRVLNDPKVQRLAPPLFKHWVNLLCVASDNDGRIPPIRDIAFALRIAPKDAEKIVNSLVAERLIDVVGDAYAPHDWVEWQRRGDNSAPRAKRYRDRLRSVTSNGADRDASRDGHALEQSRADTEQSRADARRAPIANSDAVRILQAIVAMFGESELTMSRWRWDQIDLLLAAGFLEREIMLAAEKTKSSGVVPTNLAKYLRPILDEMRVRPAPPRPHMNFKKIAG